LSDKENMSNAQAQIHPTAVVDSDAELGPGVEVGPFVVIGPDVRIGAGTVMKAHSVIEGRTEIGEQNIIGPFASLGMPPQDVKYKGEATRLKVGNRNVIREQATLHIGTVGGRSETVVGDDCMLLVGVHIAHDCIIGNGVIIANASHLGGHVEVEDNAVLGALVGIHQHVRVGTVTMVAAKAGIPMDVPPYTIAAGDRASLFGLNRVGMKRVGIPKESRAALKTVYKILFQSSLKLEVAMEKARREAPPSPEVENMLDFIEKSTRGITR